MRQSRGRQWSTLSYQFLSLLFSIASFRRSRGLMIGAAVIEWFAVTAVD